MKKTLERLDKRLIIDYFNEYEFEYVAKSYFISLVCLLLLTVIISAVFNVDIMIIVSLALVDVGLANVITHKRILCEYKKCRQSKSWLKKFKSVTLKYRNDMLFEGFISKPEYDAYKIYEKIELAELELLRFEQRELYLNSLAYKELTYSLDLVEELDSMNEADRRRELNKILNEERKRLDAISV